MKHVSHLILNLYNHAQSCSPIEFHLNAFADVKAMLKFDSGGLATFSVNNNSRFQMKTAYMYKQSEEKASYRNQHIHEEKIKKDGILDSPDPVLKAAFSDPGVAKYSDIYTSTGNNPLMRAYLEKFEIRNVLEFSDRDAHGVNFIALWRAKSRHQFDDSDGQLANILLPHMANAIQLNRRLSNVDQHHAAPPINKIISSLNGCIHFIDNPALSLLTTEWPDWQPPMLPAELLNSLGSSQSKRYSGKLLTAKARLELGLLVIDVMPQPSSPRLTPVELMVAEMLARNETYKAIAQQLGNQPATVRNQAHSIYSKLGISGKAELAKILHQAS